LRGGERLSSQEPPTPRPAGVVGVPRQNKGAVINMKLLPRIQSRLGAKDILCFYVRRRCNTREGDDGGGICKKGLLQSRRGRSAVVKTPKAFSISGRDTGGTSDPLAVEVGRHGERGRLVEGLYESNNGAPTRGSLQEGSGTGSA